jgi:hypothetical protein
VSAFFVLLLLAGWSAWSSLGEVAQGTRNPWAMFVFHALVFLVVYAFITVACAALHKDCFDDFDESVRYSIDTIADRGRISEPSDMSPFCKWVTCAEAIFGQLVPGIIFGLIIAQLTNKRQPEPTHGRRG